MARMAAQAFPNGDGALALREMNDKTRSADVALRNASEKAPAAAASTRRATCAPRSSTIINATTFVSSPSAAMKSSIACRRESSDRRARISAMVARYNADVILEGGEGARRNERHCCSLRADQFGHATPSIKAVQATEFGAPPGAMDATTSSGLSLRMAPTPSSRISWRRSPTAPRRVRSASTTDAKRCIRSRCRNHRVSRFRWLPQSTTAPMPNCLDFGWRSRRLQKKRFAGEDLR